MFPVLFYLYAGFLLTNCCFYLYFCSFCFSKNQKKAESPSTLPLSIIVCAKNEARNLAQNIPFLLEQQYPKFEIILVNDSSTDETGKVMSNFEAKNSNVRKIDASPNTGLKGKKNALNQGIMAAKFEFLLLIDADCRPISKLWMQEMASGFSEEKEIILGYGGYAEIQHSWLNKIIRFETILTAIQYFGFAKNGNPYMAVGRNLGYTKTIFRKRSGFTAHSNLASGDEDLFVNAAGAKKNTTCVYSNNSFTISQPKTTWSEWLLQK
ncbi:MAG: glycosyltransferase, partial [Leeuwenhoekiella sp.]